MNQEKKAKKNIKKAMKLKLNNLKKISNEEY